MANAFGFGLGLCPDRAAEECLLQELKSHSLEHLPLFSAFPVMMRLASAGRTEMLRQRLQNPGMWRRLLKEDATIFEGRGCDTKWNSSLFHLSFFLCRALPLRHRPCSPV